MVWTPLITFAQGMPAWWWQQHLPGLVFVFCFGACVGSFINVVNYRLPAGMSILSPPSKCPRCGAKLKFFRENLPILGWFILRGKCRYCKSRISAEYMIVELLMALMFVGLYYLAYVVVPHTPWWGEIFGPWWHYGEFVRTFPAYFALAFLLAGLFSMTVIDARTFTIPLPIPVFITICAFVFYAIQSQIPSRRPHEWMMPPADWQCFSISTGGIIGVVIALALLKFGKLKYSFADYHLFVKDNEPLADYPHARREMLVELRFLIPVMLGLVCGWVVGEFLPATAPPAIVQALGGAFAGYLMGGGLIWAIRILGTLAFGREAMGLGDVHLLAAVGAVLGWVSPIFIFFIAPFSGIAWVLVSKGLGAIFRKVNRELPYGPHLAVATVVLILCWPGIRWAWGVYMPTVPLPANRFLP